jgi:hypothetical protein
MEHQNPPQPSPDRGPLHSSTRITCPLVPKTPEARSSMWWRKKVAAGWLHEIRWDDGNNAANFSADIGHLRCQNTLVFRIDWTLTWSIPV